MFARTHHPVNRRRHSTVWAILASVILTLSAVSFGQAHSQPVVSTSPSLQAALVAPRLDTVAVHGQGFTPGGLVQISIAGEDASGIHRQLWTVASMETFGPHSSMDPMSGYIPAGIVDESIAMDRDVVYGPNGSQDPAQGYVDPEREPSSAIYGPNGSQDPASGYVDPAADQREQARVPLCFQDFTVQAFDVQSGSMSSLAEVHATCSVTTGPPVF